MDESSERAVSMDHTRVSTTPRDAEATRSAGVRAMTRAAGRAARRAACSPGEVRLRARGARRKGLATASRQRARGHAGTGNLALLSTHHRPCVCAGRPMRATACGARARALGGDQPPTRAMRAEAKSSGMALAGRFPGWHTASRGAPPASPVADRRRGTPRQCGARARAANGPPPPMPGASGRA